MPDNILSQVQLKSVLHYAPDTGEFTWFNSKNVAFNGKLVRGLDKDGYRTVKIFGKTYKAHRLAFLWVEGHHPVNEVDHINHDPGDNRWCNLRHATHGQNMKNVKRHNTNTSGVSGVSFNTRTQKWRANIRVAGRQKQLCATKSFHKAVAVRKAAEVMYDFHPNHGALI